MSTIKEFVDRLRNNLQPRGHGPNSDIVKLELGNYGYIDGQLVRNALDDLEKLMVLRSIDVTEKPSALETLAIFLLADSAGVKLGEPNGSSTSVAKDGEESNS